MQRNVLIGISATLNNLRADKAGNVRYVNVTMRRVCATIVAVEKQGV
jgi:hypothetical protein